MIRKNHVALRGQIMSGDGMLRSCSTARATDADGLAAQVRARVMAKQMKITLETDSLLVIRGRMPLRAWCAKCGAEGEMIPLGDLGVVSNLPPAEVRAWMESEDLHHSTAADGAPMICLNSMLKRGRKARTASTGAADR